MPKSSPGVQLSSDEFKTIDKYSRIFYTYLVISVVSARKDILQWKVREEVSMIIHEVVSQEK